MTKFLDKSFSVPMVPRGKRSRKSAHYKSCTRCGFTTITDKSYCPRCSRPYPSK